MSFLLNENQIAVCDNYNYVYSINQNADGRFYIHLVTNGSICSVQPVCNSSSALSIANAMTLDVFGTQGQRTKKMYIPSRGLVH